MSVTIETIISCDGSSKKCQGNDWSADARHMSATDQRKMIRKSGWHKVGNLDFCPACWQHRKDYAPRP